MTYKIIKIKFFIYLLMLFFVFLFFGTAVSAQTNSEFVEYAIKTRTENIVSQIDVYIKLNPGKTVADIFEDKVFKDIIFQLASDNSYGAIADPATGVLLLHPLESMVGVELSALGGGDSNWLDLVEKSSESEVCGRYNWLESDGGHSDKYLCTKFFNINNKQYSLAVTAYMSEFENITRREEKESFKSARLAIKQKAEDVAKQIEIYLGAYPDKTVSDLQNDLAFQEIAVQPVGKTGYTAVTDCNSGEFYFTPQKSMIGKNIDIIKDIVPEVWHKFNEIRGNCKNDGMFYNWPEEDGTISEKYTYLSCISVLTADGKSLVVDASTYLEEFSGAEEAATNNDEPFLAAEQKDINYTVVTYWLIGVLCFIFLSIFALHWFKIVKFKKNTVLYLPGIALPIIIGLFVFNTWLIAESIKEEAAQSTKSFLSAIVISRANHIRDLLDKQIEKVQLIKVGNTYREMLKMTADNPEYQELHARIQNRLIKSLDKKTFEIFILDKDGKIIISTNKKTVGVDKSTDLYFINAKEKTYVKDAYYSNSSKKELVAVSSPFLGNKNEFLGMLVVKFEMKHINKITTNSIGLGGSGEVYLINKEGYMITPSRFVDNTFLTQKIDSLNAENCFSVDHNSNNNIDHDELVIFKDYRGVKVMGAHVYIPEMQWCALIEIDKTDALGSVTKNINRIWYFTAGIIFAILLIGFVFNFLLNSSLKKEITNKTEDIQKNAKFIKEQLKKEEEATRVQERLVKEQKQAKAALEEKVEELEKFQKLTVNREIRMIELKKKIKDLEEKLL